MRLITLFTLMLLSTSVALAGPRHYTSNVVGDVNADGVVNIADINVVIDAIMRGNFNPDCDVNGDGATTITDVNYLIGIILGGAAQPAAETGVYLGVMGYNQEVDYREMAYLDSLSVLGLTDFVNSLGTRPGRLLYYTVDQALDALTQAAYPENLQNVAVVTFTSGLDQGSLMMTDRYDTEGQYAQALNDRIAGMMVYGRPVKSYTVGLLGDNVKDENQFRANLFALASDSAKAMEANSMAEVNARFQAIADDLVSRNMSETLTLIFPGVGTGTRIRFTLDNVTDATVSDSQVYIEGTFSLKTRSLTDIVYHGLTCNAGDSVAAISVDGMFVSLVFDGIQLNSEERINKNNISEWYWVEDQNAWEPSTEFTVDRLPDVESTYSSAQVLLLLDCSSVMDDNFDELKTAANSFIERMLNYNTVPGVFTVNGVSFQMVAVDGGTFTMGSDLVAVAQNAGNMDEIPEHEVTLSPYSIGMTEVTQELWQAVMGTNPSGITGDPQRPVEQVSWDDCQEFIARLNAITGKNFRLPTEAEWEFAARGGAKGMGYTYAGGNNIDEVAWYHDNSYAVGSDSPDYGTHPVATKRANELGLYDMSGNVFEWCSDWYGPYSDDAQTDPAGPDGGVRRVTRGGGWFSAGTDCRVTFRNYEAPGSRSYSLGFRLAL